MASGCLKFYISRTRFECAKELTWKLMVGSANWPGVLILLARKLFCEGIRHYNSGCSRIRIDNMEGKPSLLCLWWWGACPSLSLLALSCLGSGLILRRVIRLGYALVVLVPSRFVVSYVVWRVVPVLHIMLWNSHRRYVMVMLILSLNETRVHTCSQKTS
jgi:hypothetical protein